MVTADDLSSGGYLQGQTLRADSDFAVTADADAGALAKDVRPPRATRNWTQSPAVFLLSQIPRGVRCRTNFAVLFHMIMMFAQLIQKSVTGRDLSDVLGGK